MSSFQLVLVVISRPCKVLSPYSLVIIFPGKFCLSILPWALYLILPACLLGYYYINYPFLSVSLAFPLFLALFLQHTNILMTFFCLKSLAPWPSCFLSLQPYNIFFIAKLLLLEKVVYTLTSQFVNTYLLWNHCRKPVSVLTSLLTLLSPTSSKNFYQIQNLNFYIIWLPWHTHICRISPISQNSLLSWILRLSWFSSCLAPLLFTFFSIS